MTASSSFSLEHVHHSGFTDDDVRVREIEVVPLADVLDEHLSGEQVDFLKVDVEGAEDEVIESCDWARHRPRILVFEAFYVRREDLLQKCEVPEDALGWDQHLLDPPGG